MPPPPLPMAARERLQLLSGITGFNEPGVLLALMGGSGAGERGGFSSDVETLS